MSVFIGLPNWAQFYWEKNKHRLLSDCGVSEDWGRCPETSRDQQALWDSGTPHHPRAGKWSQSSGSILSLQNSVWSLVPENSLLSKPSRREMPVHLDPEIFVPSHGSFGAQVGPGLSVRGLFICLHFVFLATELFEMSSTECLLVFWEVCLLLK